MKTWVWKPPYCADFPERGTCRRLATETRLLQPDLQPELIDTARTMQIRNRLNAGENRPRVNHLQHKALLVLRHFNFETIVRT